MIKKEISIQEEWEILCQRLSESFGKKPDLNGVLFLIGVQELGKGFRHFEKEEKQDLMHIATCKVLSTSGYYELEGLDNDGWPHWKSLKPMPKLALMEQELFLKHHILEYFSETF